MRHKFRVLLLAASAAAIAAVASGAFVGIADPSSDAQQQASKQERGPVSLREGFAPMREARTASDRLPQGAAEELNGIARNLGVETAESRLLSRSEGRSVYLVPGPENACLVTTTDSGRATGCAPAAKIASGTALTGGAMVTGPDTFAVFGATPDGIDQVNVGLSDGRTIPVTVDGNAFSVEVTGTPVALSWQTSDGATHRQQVFTPPRPQ